LIRSEALLATIPRDRPVSLVLRHAARDERPGELPGASVPLTPAGVEAARRLGRSVVGRLRSIHTSAVLRCRATAALLDEGAGGGATPIVDDRLLGAPGVFVVDERLAGETWRREGHERVLAHLCGGVGVWPGLAEPARATSTLLQHLLEVGAADESAGVSVFVTHDSVLGPALRRWFAPEQVAWPDYLDSAALWRERGEVVMRTS
jgi:broad specificity phosphatase PhoE